MADKVKPNKVIFAIGGAALLLPAMRVYQAVHEMAHQPRWASLFVMIGLGVLGTVMVHQALVSLESNDWFKAKAEFAIAGIVLLTEITVQVLLTVVEHEPVFMAFLFGGLAFGGALCIVSETWGVWLANGRRNRTIAQGMPQVPYKVRKHFPDVAHHAEMAMIEFSGKGLTLEAALDDGFVKHRETPAEPPVEVRMTAEDLRRRRAEQSGSPAVTAGPALSTADLTRAAIAEGITDPAEVIRRVQAADPAANPETIRRNLRGLRSA